MAETTDRPAWLPPDQTPTQKWPVVGERAPLPVCLDLDAWTFEVTGLVSRPLTIPPRTLIARGTQSLTTDLHCVTRWSHRAMHFTGLPVSALLEEARPLPEATYVRFVSFSPRAHDTGLPLDVARRDTWLVHAADGAPLSVAHGAPLRTLTVGRYLYKSLKWVRRIELLAAPQLGYWEREDGYHENADPWPGNQRYVGGSLAPDALARFRVATDFTAWRGKTLRGLDLRGWRPSDRDLSGLALKDCDLRGADFTGVDLRGANLTMARLAGASLRGADLTGADLEGAWLAGADLTDACLRQTALNGTSFYEPSDVAGGARLTGARFGGAVGLLESQVGYVLAAPIAEGPVP